MNWMKLGTALAVSVSLAGCATITRGTKQKFFVNSDPSGADVEMTNGLRCRTPCKMKVDRKTDMIVRVMKEGYEPVEVHVQGKVKGGGVAGGVVGNAILGGLIGLGVDASTGAMLNLRPNPVDVKLVPIGTPQAPAAVAAPAGAAPAPEAATAPAATATAPTAPAVAPAAPAVPEVTPTPAPKP